MCKSNTVEYIANQFDIQDDILFLRAINTTPSNKKWSVILKVNDQNNNFKINTRSDICAISNLLYYNLFNKINLQKTQPKLLATKLKFINNVGTFMISL